ARRPLCRVVEHLPLQKVPPKVRVPAYNGVGVVELAGRNILTVTELDLIRANRAKQRIAMEVRNVDCRMELSKLLIRILPDFEPVATVRRDRNALDSQNLHRLRRERNLIEGNVDVLSLKLAVHVVVGHSNSGRLRVRKRIILPK